MRIVLAPGEKLVIDIQDGEEEVFTIDYSNNALTINAGLADSFNRAGEIYRENYGEDEGPFAVEAEERWNRGKGQSMTLVLDEDEEEDAYLPPTPPPQPMYEIDFTLVSDRTADECAVHTAQVNADSLQAALRKIVDEQPVAIDFELSDALVLHPDPEDGPRTTWTEIPEEEMREAIIAIGHPQNV